MIVGCCIFYYLLGLGAIALPIPIYISYVWYDMYYTLIIPPTYLLLSHLLSYYWWYNDRSIHNDITWHNQSPTHLNQRNATHPSTVHWFISYHTIIPWVRIWPNTNVYCCFCFLLSYIHIYTYTLYINAFIHSFIITILSLMCLHCPL